MESNVYEPSEATIRKINKTRNTLIILLLVVLTALVFALLIDHFVLFAWQISGDSMHTTLEDKDMILISRSVTLNHNDIVVFEAPDKQSQVKDVIATYSKASQKNLFSFQHNKCEYFVKRIIGKSGDTIIIKEGKVYVNNQLLKENYVSFPTAPSFGIVVPQGYVFVLGDNRKTSYDSRYFGCIPANRIIGTVIYDINKNEVLKY